jgi:hypothetical protein
MRLAEDIAMVAVAVVVTILGAVTAPIWVLWMWLQDRKRAAR